MVIGVFTSPPSHDDYIEVRHSSLRLPRITGYRAQRDKLFAVVIGLRPSNKAAASSAQSLRSRPQFSCLSLRPVLSRFG